VDIFNLRIHSGQNLVDTLTGQSVVVGDLLKARSSSPLGNNFPVSVRVLPRARLQRSPLPSGDEVESLDALVGQEVRPVALPNVTNPDAEFDFPAVEGLDVESRDVRVSFSGDELGERADVHDESVSVVHGMYNSGGDHQPPKQIQIFHFYLYGGGKGSRMGDSDSEFEEQIFDFVKFLENLSDQDRRRLDHVMATFQEEIMAAQTSGESKELLFAGASGRYVVKCLHFPLEVLGDDGPVILPSANEQVILAAVSDEFITKKVAEYTERFPDPLARERRWEIYLNSLAIHIVETHEDQQSFDWQEIFN